MTSPRVAGLQDLKKHLLNKVQNGSLVLEQGLNEPNKTAFTSALDLGFSKRLLSGLHSPEAKGKHISPEVEGAFDLRRCVSCYQRDWKRPLLKLTESFLEQRHLFIEVKGKVVSSILEWGLLPAPDNR